MSPRELRLWIGLGKFPNQLLVATSTCFSSAVIFFPRHHFCRLTVPLSPPPTALFLATVAVWWLWTTSRRRSCSTWGPLSCTAPPTPTRGSRARQESHGSPPEVKKESRTQTRLCLRYQLQRQGAAVTVLMTVLPPCSGCWYSSYTPVGPTSTLQT